MFSFIKKKFNSFFYKKLFIFEKKNKKFFIDNEKKNSQSFFFKKNDDNMITTNTKITSKRLVKIIKKFEKQFYFFYKIKNLKKKSINIKKNKVTSLYKKKYNFFLYRDNKFYFTKNLKKNLLSFLKKIKNYEKSVNKNKIDFYTEDFFKNKYSFFLFDKYYNYYKNNFFKNTSFFDVTNDSYWNFKTINYNLLFKKKIFFSKKIKFSYINFLYFLNLLFVFLKKISFLFLLIFFLLIFFYFEFFIKIKNLFFLINVDILNDNITYGIDFILLNKKFMLKYHYLGLDFFYDYDFKINSFLNKMLVNFFNPKTQFNLSLNNFNYFDTFFLNKINNVYFKYYQEVYNEIFFFIKFFQNYFYSIFNNGFILNDNIDESQWFFGFYILGDCLYKIYSLIEYIPLLNLFIHIYFFKILNTLSSYLLYFLTTHNPIYSYLEMRSNAEFSKTWLFSSKFIWSKEIFDKFFEIYFDFFNSIFKHNYNKELWRFFVDFNYTGKDKFYLIFFRDVFPFLPKIKWNFFFWFGYFDLSNYLKLTEFFYFENNFFLQKRSIFNMNPFSLNLHYLKYFLKNNWIVSKGIMNEINWEFLFLNIKKFRFYYLVKNMNNSIFYSRQTDFFTRDSTYLILKDWVIFNRFDTILKILKKLNFTYQNIYLNKNNFILYLNKIEIIEFYFENNILKNNNNFLEKKNQINFFFAIIFSFKNIIYVIWNNFFEYNANIYYLKAMNIFYIKNYFLSRIFYDFFYNFELIINYISINFYRYVNLFNFLINLNYYIRFWIIYLFNYNEINWYFFFFKKNIYFFNSERTTYLIWNQLLYQPLIFFLNINYKFFHFFQYKLFFIMEDYNLKYNNYFFYNKFFFKLLNEEIKNYNMFKLSLYQDLNFNSNLFDNISLYPNIFKFISFFFFKKYDINFLDWFLFLQINHYENILYKFSQNTIFWYTYYNNYLFGVFSFIKYLNNFYFFHDIMKKDTSFLFFFYHIFLYIYDIFFSIIEFFCWFKWINLLPGFVNYLYISNFLLTYKFFFFFFNILNFFILFFILFNNTIISLNFWKCLFFYSYPKDLDHIYRNFHESKNVNSIFNFNYKSNMNFFDTNKFYFQLQNINKQFAKTSKKDIDILKYIATDKYKNSYWPVENKMKFVMQKLNFNKLKDLYFYNNHWEYQFQDYEKSYSEIFNDFLDKSDILEKIKEEDPDRDQAMISSFEEKCRIYSQKLLKDNFFFNKNNKFLKWNLNYGKRFWRRVSLPKLDVEDNLLFLNELDEDDEDFLVMFDDERFETLDLDNIYMDLANFYYLNSFYSDFSNLFNFIPSNRIFSMYSLFYVDKNYLPLKSKIYNFFNVNLFEKKEKFFFIFFRFLMYFFSKFMEPFFKKIKNIQFCLLMELFFIFFLYYQYDVFLLKDFLILNVLFLILFFLFLYFYFLIMYNFFYFNKFLFFFDLNYFFTLSLLSNKIFNNLVYDSLNFFINKNFNSKFFVDKKILNFFINKKLLLKFSNLSFDVFLNFDKIFLLNIFENFYYLSKFKKAFLICNKVQKKNNKLLNPYEYLFKYYLSCYLFVDNFYNIDFNQKKGYCIKKNKKINYDFWFKNNQIFWDKENKIYSEKIKNFKYLNFLKTNSNKYFFFLSLNLNDIKNIFLKKNLNRFSFFLFTICYSKVFFKNKKKMYLNLNFFLLMKKIFFNYENNLFLKKNTFFKNKNKILNKNNVDSNLTFLKFKEFEFLSCNPYYTVTQNEGSKNILTILDFERKKELKETYAFEKNFIFNFVNKEIFFFYEYKKKFYSKKMLSNFFDFEKNLKKLFNFNLVYTDNVLYNNSDFLKKYANNNVLFNVFLEKELQNFFIKKINISKIKYPLIKYFLKNNNRFSNEILKQKKNDEITFVISDDLSMVNSLFFFKNNFDKFNFKYKFIENNNFILKKKINNLELMQFNNWFKYLLNLRKFNKYLNQFDFLDFLDLDKKRTSFLEKRYLINSKNLLTKDLNYNKLFFNEINFSNVKNKVLQEKKIFNYDYMDFFLENKKIYLLEDKYLWMKTLSHYFNNNNFYENLKKIKINDEKSKLITHLTEAPNFFFWKEKRIIVLFNLLQFITNLSEKEFVLTTEIDLNEKYKLNDHIFELHKKINDVYKMFDLFSLTTKKTFVFQYEKKLEKQRIKILDFFLQNNVYKLYFENLLEKDNNFVDIDLDLKNRIFSDSIKERNALFFKKILEDEIFFSTIYDELDYYLDKKEMLENKKFKIDNIQKNFNKSWFNFEKNFFEKNYE